jgi:hypothetical protein
MLTGTIFPPIIILYYVLPLLKGDGPPADVLSDQGGNGHTTRAPPPGTKQSAAANDIL